MADLPLASHTSQLVISLASRVEVEQKKRGNDISDSESEKTVSSNDPKISWKYSLSEFESNQSSADSMESKSTGSKRKRKPIRVHHVGHGTPKRKHERSPTPPATKPNSKKKRSPPIPAPRVDLRLGGVDPFGALELPQNSTTDMAMHHWVSVFQNTRMAMSPRKGWLEINLSDKTLLSVTTFCSASHFYFMRRMRPPPACLVQKANAIANINTTLRKPNTLPSDYIMVAVAVMTLVECLSGDVRECVVHRRGLQLMVHMRGGLENLGFNGAAQRTLSWADTACALLLRTKPSLVPYLSPDLGESPIPGFKAGDLKDRILLLTEPSSFSKQIIFVWLRLRYLTDFLLGLPAEKDNAIDEYFFTDKLDFVERLILGLLHSDGLAESGAAAFFTAFLNASIIYIYEELRECPKWTNVCICLSQRIYSGLQLANLSFIARHCSDLLLWVLLLGRSGNSPIGGELGVAWYGNAISDMENHLNMKVPKAVVGLEYFTLAEATRSMK